MSVGRHNARRSEVSEIEAPIARVIEGYKASVAARDITALSFAMVLRPENVD